MKLESFQLIGIALPTKTTNENGQSIIDCGSLWQAFEKGQISSKISGKLSNEVLAVYHEYDGDYTNPFAYFIGCKVEPGTEAPEGMESLQITSGEFQKITAKGKMPDCIGTTWREIWQSDINRAYKADFEVYGEKSYDWNNAEVDIFVSVL